MTRKYSAYTLIEFDSRFNHDNSLNLVHQEAYRLRATVETLEKTQAEIESLRDQGAQALDMLMAAYDKLTMELQKSNMELQEASRMRDIYHAMLHMRMPQ